MGGSYEYDYTDLITVVVGKKKEEQRFLVHKDVICGKSKFFEAAVSTKRWREGQEKLVRLPECKPRAFQAYMHWLHSGSVVPEVYLGKAIEEEEEKEALVEAFIIGDFLDDASLRRAALDVLVGGPGKWKYVTSYALNHRIYDATPPASPLRKFIVH